MIAIIESAREQLGDSIGSYSSDGYSGEFLEVTEETVQLAEARLGLVFPADYRQFVMTYGNLMIGGLWIYGILNTNFDDPLICDGVRATIDSRKFSNLPSNLYIIVDEDGDQYHCIDCSSASGEVKIWDVYKQKGIEIIAESFSKYLEMQISSAIEASQFHQSNSSN